jgi:nicotinate-nucleotide adenylyltransferase
MNPRRPVARINRPRPEPASPRPEEGSPRPLRRRRIGLLGGSFNPAHEGHLAISRQALRHLGLDRVWWLVSPQNPLKPVAGMAGFADRFGSAQALALGDRRIVVSDLEHRLDKRYTIDTILWLKHHCNDLIVWLIGADNLLQLPKWHHWRRLLALVPIAVFDREPYSYPALAGRVARAFADRRLEQRAARALAQHAPPAWVYLRLRRHEASSTAIRREQASSGRRARPRSDRHRHGDARAASQP